VPTLARGKTAAEIDFGAVDRLQGQGQFAQAIALLQASLADADEEAAARCAARISALREAARAALGSLLAESAAAAKDDPREAAQLLFAARHRFPPTAEFEVLATTQRAYEQQAAAAVAAPAAGTTGKPAPGGAADRAVGDATRAATLSAARTRLDVVREAEARGDFETAATALRAAAGELRERDADFAARLELRATEAELLSAWHRAVATALQSGRRCKLASDSGARELVGVDGGTLVGDGVGARWTWYELDGKSVAAIAHEVAAAGPAALGAAVLLYKQGERQLAETLLARTLRADETMKAAIDRVIARGRGEPLDERGYALGKDGFQSVRSIEVEKQAQQLAARLDRALREKEPKARDALLAEVLTGGPEVIPVLAAAMQGELSKQIRKLNTSGVRKQFDKLAAQRQLLDKARQHALELIYDTRKYFAPYRPPEVSSDRYAEYLRVQAEVDRRVAAVNTYWKDDRARIRVGAALRTDLDRVEWLGRSLANLGELDHAQLAPLEWARALPSGETVGIRDFCFNATERAEIEEWRHVDTYNEVVGKTLLAAQREVLKITNEYRWMFRHRPVAAVATVCSAAQGHAVEMAKLNYFSHKSPTPGRTTPYDRMRLAGYDFGVSENIARAPNAAKAHYLWCQSSGHHRNLLDPALREIGIGADGEFWVQNFGAGSVHRDEPAWATTDVTRR
jgi:uncharacterized protein YkwD